LENAWKKERKRKKRKGKKNKAGISKASRTPRIPFSPYRLGDALKTLIMISNLAGRKDLQVKLRYMRNK
jgi:hypothetical protein